MYSVYPSAHQDLSSKVSGGEEDEGPRSLEPGDQAMLLFFIP